MFLRGIVGKELWDTPILGKKDHRWMQLDHWEAITILQVKFDDIDVSELSCKFGLLILLRFALFARRQW